MDKKVWWVTATAVAALGLGACGDDDEKAANDVPAVRVAGTEYAFAMPDRVEGGITRMDFVNSGKEPHEFGLGRLDPGKTLADLDKVHAKGAEPPGWVHDIGGVPALGAGERLSITRRLKPGKYVFVCFIPGPGGKPHYELGMKKEFTVAGDSGASAPRTDGVVVASDKEMKVPSIQAGERTLELRNSARKPREFNLLTFQPGKGPRDAEKWFNSGFKGKPPLKLLGAMQSIAPASSVFLTVRFESGRTYYFSDEENKLRAKFTVD